MFKNKPTEPCLFIIFGATGDLTARKLLPSLYRLFVRGFIKENFHVLGLSRNPSLTEQSFRDKINQNLTKDKVIAAPKIKGWCKDYLHFHCLQEDKPGAFKELGSRIEELEKKYHLPGNRVFYLALPPTDFPGVVAHLSQAGLNRAHGWVRVVIEKPFGRDLASAKELNRLVHEHFTEEQVYRIDHYLGKETVQNLLAFRFSNSIFEPLWNRDHIDSVQILVAEQLGVGSRANYYEQAGAVRDMLQNHLTQLLTLIAMDPPSAFESEAIHTEKLKVLRSIVPIKSQDAVFGQYASGEVQKEKVSGYCQEPGVAKDSKVETFFALRLEIADWRWQGVPFFLRTGKRLARATSQIAITYRKPPLSIFNTFGTDTLPANVLNITIQPEDSVDLAVHVKVPGQPFKLHTHHMHYECAGFLADAYETLLLEVVKGDQTLFVRSDEVEESWKLYAPLLQHNQPVHLYPAGTWGPVEADRLLEGHGRWEVI